MDYAAVTTTAPEALRDMLASPAKQAEVLALLRRLNPATQSAASFLARVFAGEYQSARAFSFSRASPGPRLASC